MSSGLFVLIEVICQQRFLLPIEYVRFLGLCRFTENFFVGRFNVLSKFHPFFGVNIARLVRFLSLIEQRKMWLKFHLRIWMTHCLLLISVKPALRFYFVSNLVQILPFLFYGSSNSVKTRI
jgi:hypothetical protein